MSITIRDNGITRRLPAVRPLYWTPLKVAAGEVGVYIGLLLVITWTIRTYSQVPQVAADLKQILPKIVTFILDITLGYYGLFRSVSLHPLASAPYRNWLQ